MNNWDFSFEQSPWEATFERLPQGSDFSALCFLTLTEGEDEDHVEQAFTDLQDRDILLNVSDLPKPELSGTTAARLKLEEQMVRSGSMTTGLDETDPLRLYLEEVSQMPAADIPALLKKCASGSDSAMGELANACLGRAVDIAKEYVGCGVLLLDLIQEGSLALWNAVTSEETFADVSFADRAIHGAMAKAVVLQARANGVGLKVRKQVEEYRAADRHLLNKLGRNPTVEEIAAELRISAEEADALEEMLRSAEQAGKTSKPEAASEDDPDEAQSVENTAYFQSRQRIAEMLADLTEQDALILTLRFGLEGGMPMTPQQIGEKLGISPAEAVSREEKALALLRSKQ